MRVSALASVLVCVNLNLSCVFLQEYWPILFTNWKVSAALRVCVCVCVRVYVCVCTCVHVRVCAFVRDYVWREHVCVRERERMTGRKIECVCACV